MEEKGALKQNRSVTNDANVPSRMMVLGGSALSLLLAVGSVWWKEGQDVASLSRAEADHSETDQREFVQMQAQLDRRLSVNEAVNHDQNDRANKIAESVIALGLIVSENKAQVAALSNQLTSIAAQFNQGRGERQAADDTLSRRIEALAAVAAELQRQLSQIEGKLGEGTPDINMRPLGRKP